MYEETTQSIGAGCDLDQHSEAESGREGIGGARAEVGARLVEFPLRSGFWKLDPKKVEIWEQLYPSLDVQQELNKAWAWVDAHPSRRKTARGMAAYLSGWLNRAQPSIWKDRDRSEARTAYEKWRYHGGCPHTPRCGNFTTCQVVSQRGTLGV